MTRIHTVTLNPAVDIRNGNKYAGGKGINVSRALHNLGVEDVLTYTFSGGARGKELLHLMEEAGLNIIIQEIEAEIRSTKIVRGWPEIKKSTESPAVQISETAGLIEKLDKNVLPGDYVVLAGSMPRGISPLIYGYLVPHFNDKQANVILDSSQKDALKAGMYQHPFAMKPNEQEWAEVIGIQGEIQKILPKLMKRYKLEYAFCMRGAKGIIFLNNSGIIKAIPPQVKVGSTVGCGDAVTAGFLYGLLNNYSDREIARFSTACGTASAEKEGTELCTLEDTLRVAEEVLVIS